MFLTLVDLYLEKEKGGADPTLALLYRSHNFLSFNPRFRRVEIITANEKTFT